MTFNEGCKSILLWLNWTTPEKRHPNIDIGEYQVKYKQIAKVEEHILGNFPRWKMTKWINLKQKHK